MGFGLNAQGELGDGTKINRFDEPVKIAENVKELHSQVLGYTFYITLNGEDWFWSGNDPTPKKGNENIASFYNAGSIFAYITTDGETYVLDDRNQRILDDVKLRIPQTLIFE